MKLMNMFVGFVATDMFLTWNIYRALGNSFMDISPMITFLIHAFGEWGFLLVVPMSIISIFFLLKCEDHLRKKFGREIGYGSRLVAGLYVFAIINNYLFFVLRG